MTEGRGAPWCSPGLAERELRSVSWIVVDIETTGLVPAHDSITEFAAIAVSDHGGARVIVDWRAADSGEPLASALSRVARELARGLILVAHNLAFDTAFLAALGDGVPPTLISPPNWMCSMRMTGRRTSLDELAAAAHITVTDRHTALGDVATLASIVAALTMRARHNGETNVAGLAAAWAANVARATSRQASSGAGWSGVRSELDYVVPMTMVSRAQRAVLGSALDNVDDVLRGPRTLAEHDVVVTALRDAGVTVLALDQILAELGIQLRA